MKKLLLAVLGLAWFAALAQAADVPDLIKKLKDKDNEIRRGAAKELSEVGKEAKPAVPALTAALEDSDLYVRRFAAQALGALGADAKDAIPAVTKSLNDSKSQVREAAVAALGKMGPDGIAPLSKALNNPYADVQEGAITALSEAGSAGVLPLADLIKDGRESVEIRCKAIEVIKDRGKEGRPALTALVVAARSVKAKGNINQLHNDAIKTLEMLAEKGDKEVIEGMTAVAGDGNAPDNIRGDAMKVLVKIATKEDTKVIDVLSKLAKDETPKRMRIKNAAKETLTKIEAK